MDSSTRYLIHLFSSHLSVWLLLRMSINHVFCKNNFFLFIYFLIFLIFHYKNKVIFSRQWYWFCNKNSMNHEGSCLQTNITIIKRFHMRYFQTFPCFIETWCKINWELPNWSTSEINYNFIYQQCSHVK